MPRRKPDFDRRLAPRPQVESEVRRSAAKRALAAERRLRDASRRRAESLIERLILQLEAEIERLRSLLAFTPDREERVMLKSEIAHLERVLAAKRGGPHRRPPEAGLPVPAVPPQGPLPKQGGAAAPLDFGV